jgi:hypothetical protein
MAVSDRAWIFVIRINRCWKRDRSDRTVMDRVCMARPPNRENHQYRSQNLDARVRHFAGPVRKTVSGRIRFAVPKSAYSADILRPCNKACNKKTPIYCNSARRTDKSGRATFHEIICYYVTVATAQCSATIGPQTNKRQLSERVVKFAKADRVE